MKVSALALLVLLASLARSALAHDRRFRAQVLAFGEPTPFDAELSAFTKAFTVWPRFAAVGQPHIEWNPSEEYIANIPHTSPVLVVTHITDDDHEDHPTPGGDPSIRFAFRPTPPLGRDELLWCPNRGEAFVWGWPEPFPWISNDEIHPAQSIIELLYPLRYHEVVFVASCNSLRAETPVFPNVIGFEEAELITRQYELREDSNDTNVTYIPIYGRLAAALQLYHEFFAMESHTISAERPHSEVLLQEAWVISDEEVIHNASLRAYSPPPNWSRTGASFLKWLHQIRRADGALDKIWAHYVLNHSNTPKHHLPREDIRRDRILEWGAEHEDEDDDIHDEE